MARINDPTIKEVLLAKFSTIFHDFKDEGFSTILFQIIYVIRRVILIIIIHTINISEFQLTVYILMCLIVIFT